MKSVRTVLGALLLFSIGICPVWADQGGELLELKNTILNLVDALVEEGILSEQKATQLKADAAARARSETAVQVESPTPTQEAAATTDVAANKVVRVPYVPEFVKDEIREQVRAELRTDVANDVIDKAREERWGVKDALPAWVTAMNWSGDFRLRYEGAFFQSGNLPSVDFQAINEAGGLTPAGINVFRNVGDDRHRLRVRARLGLEVEIADRLVAGLRLATGDLENPTSTNDTLGRGHSRIEFNVDRAWLEWNQSNANDFEWLSLAGGRIGDPFFSPSEVIWDNDLTFEGVAATLRQPLGFLEPVSGPASPVRHVFLTFGAFPLLESEIPVADNSSNDKWLWGAQAGLDFAFTRHSATTLAFAWYDYINIFGRRNTFNSRLNDWTAPQLLASGNTVFDIRNDLDLNTELFALAADFSIANLSAQYRYSGFEPFNIWLTADVVKNYGYDESEIFRRTGANVSERTLGYWTGFQLGTACEKVVKNYNCVERPGQWTIFGGYRYLQRDAVLDPFTDSNFHLGGTNSKGYMVGIDYGLLHNTWLRARYWSTDEIDGPPLGIDLFQVDLNARF